MKIKLKMNVCLGMLWLAGGVVFLPARAEGIPGASCPKPEWPREALRYELEGTTILRYAVGPDGRAKSAIVQRSSGWRVLDIAAQRNVMQCVFREPTPEGVMLPTQYVWRLDGDPPLRPQVVQGSCKQSEQFQAFRSLDKSATNAEGILLRMLINSEGMPWNVMAEAGSWPTELVVAATTYVQSCRFSIDPAVVGTRTDATYGKVLIRNQQAKP